MKQTLILAGGCFWCTEGVFEQLRGVSDVTSGYAGGTPETANYDAVCTGTTGHAEVIRVTFDSEVIAYEQLLDVFFATHDPTTKNRQGADTGPQYRSAIFYQSDEERATAHAMIEQLNDANAFGAPIVTTLEPFETFYPAEDYHQDFVRTNPTHPYVCSAALPKVEKLKNLFGDMLADPSA